MKILFLAIGNEQVASSRTRVYQYLPFLHEHGIKTRVITFIAPWQSKQVIYLKQENLLSKVFCKLYSLSKLVSFIFACPFYDILFMQKVLLPIKIQRLILKLNKNIVFDFDDAIYLSDMAAKGIDKPANGKFLSRLQYIIQHSKFVGLENDYTKEFAQKYNRDILLITGPIDVKRYTPRNEDFCRENLILGWVGSPQTSFYLETLYGVFEKLAEKYKNLLIELVGFSKRYAPKLRTNIVLKEWSLKTEVKDLQDFDIGIMPLPDEEWARGKGGYKLLQYMAVGIPSVASAVGINKQIIKEDVNGFLVNSTNEWLEKISRLMEDAELRNRIGRNARAMAEELYSFQVNAPKLIHKLEGIL